jgi:hypothetical protein
MKNNNVLSRSQSTENIIDKKKEESNPEKTKNEF